METKTLADLIADVRSRTDTETPSPTNDHVTDAELTLWLRQAYRELVDLIIDHGGEEALDTLAVSEQLTSPFTLPAQFYRLVSVDASVEGLNRQLGRVSWRKRHARTAYASVVPQFKLTGGAISFFPSDSAPSSVTLWYIPSLSDTDLATELNTFNGWDEFIVAGACLKVCEKEETDDTKFQMARQRAVARIVTACTNLSAANTQTIIAAATFAEDYQE